MAERLSEIEARIGSVHQLSMVVGTMRGIAAARSSEARGRLSGVRAYADAVGRAIAQALTLAADAAEGAPGSAAGRRIVLAFGSQQGFVGGYNTRLFDALERVLAERPAPPTEVMLIGSRALAIAGERALPLGWSTSMAAHVDEVTPLANRLADCLLDRIGGGVARVQLVHAAPAEGGGIGQVAVRTLVPFDFSRFAPATRLQPPLIQLPPALLLARLADEYVFAELCEALLLAFAAENEARMLAMVAANQSVSNRLDELTASARRLRQEQITEEVVELAAGTLAQR